MATRKAQERTPRAFRASEWFIIDGRPGDPYPEEMPGGDVSGVYIIADLKGNPLYVGESHTGRLRDTMSRHWRVWRGERVGPSYYRGQVQVAWYPCAADRTLDFESWLIDEYNPRDNELIPAHDDDGDDVPF